MRGRHAECPWLNVPARLTQAGRFGASNTESGPDHAMLGASTLALTTLARARSGVTGGFRDSGAREVLG